VPVIPACALLQGRLHTASVFSSLVVIKDLSTSLLAPLNAKVKVKWRHHNVKECRMDQEPVENVKVYEKEDVEIVEVEDRSADSLLWISSAANVLSWIVLVIYLVWAGYQVYVQITFGGWVPAFDIQAGYIVLNILWNLLLGIALFIIMQAVSKGAMVLLDIYERDLD
jgi:hypothetical protein